MAYFELLYYIWDNTNPGMVYKIGAVEAKEMVLNGRGSLWDHALWQKIETPEEWLIDESNIAEVASEEPATTPFKESVKKLRIESALELQVKYKEKFGKPVAAAYKNNKERIAKKLYS